ncbi:MAG: SNF2-related protein, partial [Nitrososphaera sp.]|nr:SNF2-related protein [Nitrososphaera sp.]
MNTLTWWQDKRIKAASKFRWFRRRKPEAEKALRIAIIPRSPEIVEHIHSNLNQAETVQWLLANPSFSAEITQVVNLEPLPERIRIPHSLSPRRTINASSERITNQTSGKDDGPSLAERLRTLLDVPLELLLPGPATVLDWPGALMPFQIEGVQELIKRDKILLADDMGLGKTLQTIAAIRILVVQRAIESVLIV